jgi:uncharacterized protein (TIGR02996 family)
MDEDALLDAVLAEPDAPGPRKVMADFLLDRGDPRGELIAAQCLLAEPGLSEDRRAALRARQQELLYQHEEGWLASYGLRPGEGELVRGFLETLTLRGARLEALHGLGRCPLRKVRAFDVSSQTLPALVGLPGLSKLESLHLSGTLAGDELRSLLMLGELSGLTTLELTNHPLGSAGAQALAGSPHLRSLRRLVLASAALGDEEIAALAEARSLQALTELSLPSNLVGARGADALARSPTFRELVRLDLRGNRLESEGAAALARSTQLARLVWLDLGQNQIGTEGALALAESRSLPSLSTLSLRNNRITTAGARALLASEPLRGVATFYLLGNELGDRAYVSLLNEFGARMDR